MDVPLNDGDIKIKDVLEVENTLNIDTMDEPNMNDFNVEVDETNLEGENVEEQNFCEPTMSDPDNVLITEVQDNKEFEHEKKISNEPETNGVGYNSLAFGFSSLLSIKPVNAKSLLFRL